MQDYRKIVSNWLFIGILFIFFQIILGGITRLTGSGLSITKWDIVTGILFPLTEQSWQNHFELYKQTPQYAKINNGIGLSDFKFIFFWEYVHRLWARLMGIVFLIPISYFVFKNYLDRNVIKRLIIVFLLAVFVASLGWIMVASGLIERPWVNAFKLSFHLMAAVLLLSYLLWTFLHYNKHNIKFSEKADSSKLVLFIFILAFIQLFFGGIMSGMKAALVAPSWPCINRQLVPSELFNFAIWRDVFFNEYELNASSGLIIQFFHRMTGYLIFVVCFYFLIATCIKNKCFERSALLLFSLVLVQLLLGILVLLNAVGRVPLLYGSLHQMMGIVFYCFTFYLCFKYLLFRKKIV